MGDVFQPSQKKSEIGKPLVQYHKTLNATGTNEKGALCLENMKQQGAIIRQNDAESYFCQVRNTFY